MQFLLFLFFSFFRVVGIHLFISTFLLLHMYRSMYISIDVEYRWIAEAAIFFPFFFRFVLRSGSLAVR